MKHPKNNLTLNGHQTSKTQLEKETKNFENLDIKKKSNGNSL